ncbi:branched-chain amino acid ABC transporter permease [Phaeobacter gallaeciensis]|uniref:branched-chain amino acid ABC transporter permease n=1 Tax=Phaeobacter gallaeciensis TaxID=60890 RepID=UPI000BBBC1D7|nr:branched-chain amino acid ABC transporter permease [Phaeobacter gallaeciensis]ATF19754.1 amino acid/amide ABC transporter membrane protein 1, HAAT family [Phaeobacter gallaeciensis]ATF23863.1 amino acid/amide ABC transporter membrane protein 1, HAAT family [Phaeobacter gallaeciensis]
MSLYLFQLLNGVGLGMIYFLMGVGLTIIFGMMNFVNFAHGVFYALGAFICYQVVQITGSYWIGLILTPILIGAVAFALEKILITKLYRVDHAVQILITIGLMLIIREGILIIWGTVPKPVATPSILQGVIFLGDFVYPKYRLFIIAISAGIGFGVWYLLERTKFGITIRAGSENPKMVSLLGVDTDRLFAFTFVFGVALAGIAGALLSPIRGADAFSGDEALGIAFVVVVIGGMGSFTGALLGGLIVGLVQSFTAILWPEGTKVMIYSVMALIILLRPNGLFGKA